MIQIEGKVPAMAPLSGRSNDTKMYHRTQPV